MSLPGVWVSLNIRDQLQLHVFVFDETLKTLRAQGRAIDLSPWYSQVDISLLQVAFVCGKEEIVLVDSSNRARLFSFISLQFRYAPQYFVMSSPCCSSVRKTCFLVASVASPRDILLT